MNVDHRLNVLSRVVHIGYVALDGNGRIRRPETIASCEDETVACEALATVVCQTARLRI